ncbi:hypothetical protein AOX55_00003883 [Sinorhizobium fredii CCBAU 25509]|nr:hypothetical protein AOX55_00003883 [Sinorhizobium fredii CCBAU 25509]
MAEFASSIWSPISSHFHLGGRPRKIRTIHRRGRKGQTNTQKTSIMMKRPDDVTP